MASTARVSTKPTFPYVAWYILEILLVLLYSLRLDRSRNHHVYAFVGFASIAMYYLCFTRMDGEVLKKMAANTAWGMGCRMAAMLLYLSANLLLTDPLRDITLAEDRKEGAVKGASGVKVEAEESNGHGGPCSMYDKSFLSRLWWGVIVSGNPRGVNFNYASSEPKPLLPPRLTQATRLSFIISQLRALAVVFLLYDLSDTVNLLNPHYTSFTEPTARELAIFGSETLGTIIWRAASLAYGTSICLVLDMEYRIMGILSVALGISKPRDWPDMFGSFADAWTLRRLWGKSWHQIFRRPTIVHANFFLRSLGFPQPPRTSAERHFVRTFTLFSVFFLTGLIHYIGDAVWMQNLNLFDKNGPGAMHFYMLQPVGILLEDGVSSSFRRLTSKEPASKANPLEMQRRSSGPPSWLARAIGYLWVVTWISLTLPLWTYPQFRHGFKNDMPHPKLIWRILDLYRTVS